MSLVNGVCTIRAHALLVIAALALMLGWWKYFPAPGLISLVRPILVVSPESLNIGTVAEQDKLEWDLPISNVSAHAVTISRFERECYCTKIQPESLTIPAHTTSTVHFTIDPTNLAPASTTELDQREINIGISINVRAIIQEDGRVSAGHVDWRLTAMMQQYLTVLPRKVSIDTPIVRESEFSPILIQVTSREPVKGLQLRSSSSDFVLNMLTRDDSTRQTFEITVTPVPTIPLGRIECDLFITPVLADGTLGHRKTVPIIGTVVEDIALVPPRFNFGRIQLGLLSSGEVTISSRTNKPFVIQSQTPHKIALSPRSSEPSSKHVLKISITPDVYGQTSFDTLFSVKYTSSEREFPVKLNCAYLGID